MSFLLLGLVYVGDYIWLRPLLPFWAFLVSLALLAVANGAGRLAIYRERQKARA
jgi:hypothetical protein